MARAIESRIESRSRRSIMDAASAISRGCFSSTVLVWVQSVPPSRGTYSHDPPPPESHDDATSRNAALVRSGGRNSLYSIVYVPTPCASTRMTGGSVARTSARRMTGSQSGRVA